MAGTRPRADRWRSEASFFDSLAERLAPEPGVDRSVLERYQRARRPWFNKEYRFRLLGDVRGRAVLDVGCGGGDNAVLLAALGARVTGIDLSPKLVELARRRAEALGVAGSTRFVCAPLETADLGAERFDVVWGDGILHHVVDELDAVLGRLVQVARPGALFVFAEPVSLLRALRWLRRRVPIHTDATPDERPLEPAELATLRRHLPDMRVRRFGLLGRFNRFIVGGAGFERASGGRRALANVACLVDQAILNVPPATRLASSIVVSGHARGSAGPGG